MNDPDPGEHPPRGLISTAVALLALVGTVAAVLLASLLVVAAALAAIGAAVLVIVLP